MNPQEGQAFTVQQTSVKEGKALLRSVLATKKLDVPSWSPKLDKRWRAMATGMVNLKPDDQKMLLAAMEKIAAMDGIADQREVYYSIRMQHPDWKYNGTPISTLKVYDAFTGKIMEMAQLASGVTIQSLGIRPGPRGTIFGDGDIYTPRRGSIPLRSKPTMNFDIVEEGVTLDSHARKHINYEKLAGFDALTQGNIAIMLEVTFSTSQGYTSEAVSKFMKDQQDRGLRLYILGDGDPHGGQIEMMYGRSSKASAYMPDAFYPTKTKLLGLFPSVAKSLGLPPEVVKATHQKIFENLKKLGEENPGYKEELEIIIHELKQWEWQALAGLTKEPSQAYQIYLTESLRAADDEIKYVPAAADVKKTIIDMITRKVNDLIENQISAAADNYYETQIKPNLTKQLRATLKPDIDDMEAKAAKELAKLGRIPQEDLREAVKLRLVKNPVQYADDATVKVVKDVLAQHFDIASHIESSTKVTDAEADHDVKVSIPEIPPKPLTKNDISKSIELEAMGGRAAEKKVDELVGQMRPPLEKKLGKPDQTW